jgi:hypothetical protein
MVSAKANTVTVARSFKAPEKDREPMRAAAGLAGVMRTTFMTRRSPHIDLEGRSGSCAAFSLVCVGRPRDGLGP